MLRSAGTTCFPSPSTSYCAERSIGPFACLHASRPTKLVGRRTAVCVAVPQQQDPFAKKEQYHDGFINRAFIKFFSTKMSESLGGRKYKQGYDGFVELSKEIMKGRNSQQQREAVGGVLDSLMPPEAQKSFRNLFPFSRWSAEVNARITTTFFAWLVGPMDLEVHDVTFKGMDQQWKSKVHIKKCRYLEQSGCVGMCVNMCQQPTQSFFTDKVGLPLTMVPNFEDLSCDMLFGQSPPPLEEDDAYMQPCFPHVCKIGNIDMKRPCPKTDTSRPQPKRKQS